MPSKYYIQKNEKECSHIYRIDRLKIEIGLILPLQIYYYYLYFSLRLIKMPLDF